MFYGSTTEATDWDEQEMNCWQVKLIKALLFFIPKANPDIEKLYPQITTWLVEVGEDSYPQREIALDKEGLVLFCTPDERNTGFWTDMGVQQFPKSKFNSITKEYFESLWHEKKYT